MITESKVFVTGIYASGKTTFAKGHSETNDLEYLCFDEIYGYTNPEKLDVVYAAMEAQDRFVMDALPLNEHESSWLRLADYIMSNKVALVVVKCPIDLWYRERLPSKASYSTAAEEDHRRWYKEFYEQTLFRIFEQLTLKAVYSYDSGPEGSGNLERMRLEC